MKFIHCADIHLDTPLQGLADYEGAPVNEIRNATRRAFEKIINASVSQEIDFLVIAGDLYDTGLKSFESALFFNKQMGILREAGIDVYLIYGNHDAASKLIKQLRPPENVRVFRSTEPQTILDEKNRVALHGQSFSTPNVTDDLAANYPAPISGLFNIGLLHTNLGGSTEHANYAPCSLDVLQNKGYDYWALGHVHNRQILNTNPYIVYPGNVQGRHGRELGEKSCELVSVSDAGVVSLEQIPTSVVPWTQVAINVAGCVTLDQVYDQVGQGFQQAVRAGAERLVAVRLRIVGPTRVYADLMRDPEGLRHQCCSLANDYGGGLLWLERVDLAISHETPKNDLLTRDDPVGEVMRTISSLRAAPESVLGWEEIVTLQKRLPLEFAEGADPILLDVASIQIAIHEAEGLLLARITGLEEL